MCCVVFFFARIHAHRTENAFQYSVTILSLYYIVGVAIAASAVDDDVDFIFIFFVFFFHLKSTSSVLLIFFSRFSMGIGVCGWNCIVFV